MTTVEGRVIRFAKTTPVARMVIKGQAIVILNPTICYPGKAYRLELDAGSYTGWIREVTS